jgi:hypothetical protein
MNYIARETSQEIDPRNAKSQLKQTFVSKNLDKNSKNLSNFDLSQSKQVIHSDSSKISALTDQNNNSHVIFDEAVIRPISWSCISKNPKEHLKVPIKQFFPISEQENTNGKISPMFDDEFGKIISNKYLFWKKKRIISLKIILANNIS